MKKYLSLILLLTFAFGILPPASFAQVKRRSTGAARAAKAAEEKRLADEAAAEEARLAEEKRKADEAAAAQRAAEEKQKQEAEAARIAEEKRQAEAQRRQMLALTFKKIELQAADNKIDEANRQIDSILKIYPTDAEAHALAANASLAMKDFVAAEFYLKKAVTLAADADARNRYELQLVEINYTREKNMKSVVAEAARLVDEMNYPEALRVLQNLDNTTLYNQEGFILRGGLLGVYRRYEDSVKTYNRVLQDPLLSADLKPQITALRDYALSKVTGENAAMQTSGKVCHFCKAKLPGKAAYCHVCASFQPHIASLKTKRIDINYAWDKDELRSVTYDYTESHNVGNGLRSVFGALSAAGGTPTSVELKDADQINRWFEFSFENGVPQGVGFSSKADIGGSTTALAQTIGGQASVTKESRTAAKVEATKLDDRLVYASHPKIDATFVAMAFKQSIYRGFAANFMFDPFIWQEPHIFALFYDNKQRLTQAVETYNYAAEANAAGHYIVTGRKNFTGANHLDPLRDSNFVRFSYNDEGLMSKIALVRGGTETYRREFTYGPNGIIGEAVYYGDSAKPVENTTYIWSGEKIISARISSKGAKDKEIIFQ